MINILQHFKIFFKYKVLLVIYTLLLVLINFFQLVSLSHFNEDILASFSQLQNSLCTAIYYFAVFLFLSYEYCRYENDLPIQKRANEKKTLFISCVNRFVVLITLNLASTLIYMIYNVGAYLSLGTKHYEFVCHIVLSMLVNFFMTGLVAILLGMLLALVFKRVVAFLVGAIVIFLGSPMFESIAEAEILSSRLNLYPVEEIFNIYTPSLFWMPNFMIGYSLLPYRIALLIFWVFALLAALLGLLIQKNKIRFGLIIVCVAFSISGIMIYFQPSSKLIMNYNPSNGLNSDLEYYENNEQKDEPGGFDVTDYALNIEVTNKLNVKSILTVSESISEYKFTLYHGYKITDVKNQSGDRLNFTQDGDYFTVYSDLDVTQLYIEYSGFSPKFYSNTQGMVLPGFFPYYPHSGFKSIFNIEEQGFYKLLVEGKPNFSLSVKGHKKVYSNLSALDNNTFTGKSTGVTIISGFIEKTSVNGIEVIYPYLDTFAFTPDIIDESVNKFIMEYHNSDVIKKIIILPNLNLRNINTALFDDYIATTTLSNLAKQCEYSEINPNKLYLYQTIELYLDNIDAFQQLLVVENSGEYAGYKIRTITNDIITNWGEDKFLEIAFAYINDDNDKRTVEDFLSDLKTGMVLYR